MMSISPSGLQLIKAVAPSSEAIYAAITRRYGARKLRELQEMLHATRGQPGGVASKRRSKRWQNWSECKSA